MKRKSIIVIAIILVIASGILQIICVITDSRAVLLLSIIQAILFLFVSLYIYKHIYMALSEKVEYYKKMAYMDSLTGLSNNNRMKEDIAFLVNNKIPCFVIFIDFSKFKKINDNYGHSEGNRVLCSFASSLLELEGQGKIKAYRHGGDEFIVILTDLEDRIEERIQSLLLLNKKTVTTAKGVAMQIRVNFGVAIYPKDASSITGIMDCADIAMYEAKKLGETIVYYKDVKKGKVC